MIDAQPAPCGQFDYRVVAWAGDESRAPVGVYRVEYTSSGRLARRNVDPVRLSAESVEDLFCEAERILDALRQPVLGERNGDLYERDSAPSSGMQHEVPSSVLIPDTPSAAPPSRTGETIDAALAALYPHPYREQLGPVTNTAGARHILRVSRHRLHRLVDRGKVLAARTGDGTLIFPLFQFDRHRVIRGFAAAAKYFRDRDVEPWAMLDWLTTPAARLNGRTPANAIRRQAVQRDQILALARETASRWAPRQTPHAPVVNAAGPSPLSSTDTGTHVDREA